jgi:tetratricopeptide (TPR) repeat protein
MSQRIGTMIPVMAVMALLWACGPDTILVRPGLDTPAQHVANGKKLLERGKIQPAYQEFMRAKELDPNYAALYVGLGLVQGHQGDLAAGLESMAHAREIAKTEEELEWIEEGYRQLYDMFEKIPNNP